jgi:hypothetical protein
MRAMVDDIVAGRFAEKWDAERDAGFPRFQALKAAAVRPEIVEWEKELRTQLGARSATPPDVLPPAGCARRREPCGVLPHDGDGAVAPRCPRAVPAAG